MEANTIIVTTPAELRAIIAKEIRTIVPELANFNRKEESQQGDGMSAKDAAAFLTEQGLPATRATLYDRVFNGTIPYRKIGRRLIFSRKELAQWLEDNTERPEPKEKAALRIAASANRKRS